MLLNGQYKPSRIASLEPLEQQMATSQFNYGTNLHHRCKTPLTSFASQDCTPTFQHTKPWRARMIVITTQWHLPVQRQSYTKIQTLKALWAPHGLDAWLLGPSKDHYWCHLYYVPKTKGYRVSGSADLFPQHFLAPSYLPISLSMSYPKNSRPISLCLIGQQ